MEITIITNIFYCFMTLVILLIYMVALLVLISQKNPNRLGLRIFLKNLGIYAVCLCSIQSRLFVQCWPRIFLAQCQGNLCNVDAVLQQLLIFPMQYCMEPLGQLAQGFYLWNVCPKLKLVSAIFIIFFIFSPNDSPSKTMKNAFYFI